MDREVPEGNARPAEGTFPEAHAGVRDPGREAAPRFTGGRVAGADHPPDGGRRAVAVDGRKLVIVRSGDERLACEDRCLHVGVRLSGAIQRGSVLECRWHHWEYDLRSGSVDAEDSPFESFTTYGVRVDGDDLVIDPTPRTTTRRKPWNWDEPESRGGAT